MERLPISVCIISNSDSRLGTALDSVKDWVAEIIVVLNDDTDTNTEQAAVARGARVFREKWTGYGAQKNAAVAHASRPWILSLDADEQVSHPLRDAITAIFMENRAEQHAAWKFPRCTQYCGRWIRHGDWYPDRQTRLWKKGAAHWGMETVHETLAVTGTTGCLRGDLMHYSCESFSQIWQKTLRYADEFSRTGDQNRRRVTLFDMYFRPPWRFIRAFVFRRGFLDGWQGYSIAWMVAIYTHLRYAMAYERQKAEAAKGIQPA